MEVDIRKTLISFESLKIVMQTLELVIYKLNEDDV